MAVIDDERRRVAERLRMSDERDAAGFVDCLLAEVIRGREFCETPCEECHARLLGELADLIEPSCDRDTPQKVAEEMFGKMRHSTKEEADAYDAMLKSKSVEIHPVDRDALLALASGLEADADRILRAARNARFGGGPRMGEAKHDAYEWRSIARRIREALGVQDA